ncbi:hypothetical protein RND81_05G163500 [Saponaria officinalis]|uniref:Cation efflux protein transmembrane domain-containing protein n=1 Tax=Saponaria officinalis TaxID=3572 RepID=A0AAW1KZ91_SAPOF
MENSRVSDSPSSSIDPKPPLNKTTSFNYSSHQTLNSPVAGNDRRYAYARQSSLQRFADPRSPTIISNSFNRSSSSNGGGVSNYSQSMFSRSVSSIDIPPTSAGGGSDYGVWKSSSVAGDKLSSIEVVSSVLRVLRSGNRPMKRLFVLISLNVAYSTAELFIGLLSGRAGLVSDAFHLTFGCGLLTFSLFAMAVSRRKPDCVYTYGFKRLEVLSAFTNATAVSSVYVIFLGC